MRRLWPAIVLVAPAIGFVAEVALQPRYPAPVRIDAATLDRTGGKYAARGFDQILGPDLPQPIAIGIPDEIDRGIALRALFRIRGLTYFGRAIGTERDVYLGLRYPNVPRTFWLLLPSRDLETVCI